MLWQQKPDLLFVTKEHFVAGLEGWEIDPREVDGELAFVFLTKGPELHFTSLKTGKPMPLAMARDVIERIRVIHGHVIVKTPKHEERQQRFNRAIGFRPFDEDDYNIHFRLEKFGQRSEPCQSLQ
jgi:hypothetical protein